MTRNIEGPDAKRISSIQQRVLLLAHISVAIRTYESQVLCPTFCILRSRWKFLV